MHKADNLPPSCAVVTKSWSLNFLEPPGPLQACNRTALPFFFTIPLTQIAAKLCVAKLQTKQENRVLKTPQIFQLYLRLYNSIFVFSYDSVRLAAWAAGTDGNLFP